MVRFRPPVGTTRKARHLRLIATDAEKHMWRLLRENFPDARFRRQVLIRRFFADFASHRAKLIIEIDGGQHDEERDADRTSLIEAEGYRVVRFWNNDVLGNEGGVAMAIAKTIEGLSPPPNHRGRRSSPGSTQGRPRSHQGGGLRKEIINGTF
ncbi:MAG: DUF559 domain-containing protein [Sphingosinicella sp.]|nr:DUF559 domain-containing protein [Sphingosinicella sp.]